MNNASMENIIKERYEQGATLDALKAEVDRLYKEQEKKKIADKNIARKRKEMIAAVANYVEAVNPDIKFKQEDLDELEKDMADKALFKFKTRKDPLEDDIILNFLRSLGK
jgi:hypothetical protein